MKLEVSKFADEFKEILQEYGDEATSAMKEAVPQVAKKARDEVKNHAPVGTRKKGYKKQGFKVQKTSETVATLQYEIGANDYRLAHLLEHGHATVKGGRTKPQPHFKYGDEYVEDNLLKEIEKKLI